MRSLQTSLLSIALVFVAASLGHGAPETARLMVDAHYFSDSRIGEQGLVHGAFPIERPIRPFRKLAARLMKASSSDGDSLTIEAEGLALGTLYDYIENRQRLRHLRFTGATMAGRVSLTSDVRGLRCSARFSGVIEPLRSGMVVGAWDYREAPQFAPFEDALYQPGSFAAALMAVITMIYRSAPPTDADLAVALAPPLPAVDCTRP